MDDDELIQDLRESVRLLTQAVDTLRENWKMTHIEVLAVRGALIDAGVLTKEQVSESREKMLKKALEATPTGKQEH